jgi:bacteriorhodopsin
MNFLFAVLVATHTLAPTYRWLWYGWGALFLVIEGSALYLRKKYPDTNRSGGTLSELFWRNIRTYDKHRHYIHYVLMAVAWVVLTFHFFIQ